VYARTCVCACSFKQVRARMYIRIDMARICYMCGAKNYGVSFTVLKIARPGWTAGIIYMYIHIYIYIIILVYIHVNVYEFIHLYIHICGANVAYNISGARNWQSSFSTWQSESGRHT